MEVSKTIGKITDATVIIGSLVVGVAGVKALVGGVKLKSVGVIAVGALTTLIAIYALKEAYSKINE